MLRVIFRRVVVGLECPAMLVGGGSLEELGGGEVSVRGPLQDAVATAGIGSPVVSAGIRYQFVGQWCPLPCRWLPDGNITLSLRICGTLVESVCWVGFVRGTSSLLG